MSLLSDLLRYQIASAAWANRRILAAVSALTPEELDHNFKTSEHSIRGTLTHIYRAERVWLGRIEGNAVSFQVEGDSDMDFIAEEWPLIGERWIQWAQTIDDCSAGTELNYQDLKNNPWVQPIWQVILHVVNHSAHHRGQVSGFIRALGHTPPDVDSITFAREQTKK